MGFALLGVATSSWVLVAGTALNFCLGWAWPGVFNFVVIELLPATPGAATLVAGTGIFTGGIFGPLGFGAVVERYSYLHAWLGATAAMVAAAVRVTPYSAGTGSDAPRRTPASRS